MPWHVYAIDPIDFWDGALTVDEYIEAVTAAAQYRYGLNDPPLDLASEESDYIRNLYAESQEVAKDKGKWEGDFAEGPFVLLLPDVGRPELALAGFMWKQRSNGTTFVITKFELPHLNE